MDGYVVGVDGCPGGWLSVKFTLANSSLTFRVNSSFSDVLASYSDALCMTVDTPIGLEQGRPLQADIAARKVLGPRISSVFPAPDRRLVGVTAYADANTQSRSLLDKGIPRQAHAIYSKIAEVNQLMNPELQEKVVEVHPEVSFWALEGRTPMTYHKSKAEGFEERRALLASAFRDISIPNRKEARQVARPAKPDDVLDAIVAAWTARRYVSGEACRLPDQPPTDLTGLRIEIVY